MKKISRLSRTAELFLLCSLMLMMCSTDLVAQKKPAAGKNPALELAEDMDFSGMYSFLKEGEFVQITVEKEAVAKGAPAKSAKVSGFISRFGDDESDKGEFLDHFFTRGSLMGKNLTFATKRIHGVSFEFSGTVQRGPAKSRSEDGYYIATGTLTRNMITPDGKIASRSREITMKLFPDMDDDAKSAKR